MKKIIGIGIGIAMMAFSAVPAMAADNTISIGVTGPGSSNIVTLSNGSNIKVTNLNAALVINKQKSTVTTGGNNIVGNTVVSGLGGTGNASSNQTINNTVNQSLTSINDCGCNSAGNNTISVGVTGPGSSNVVGVDNSRSTTVNNLNFAAVFNKQKSTVSSGGNNVVGNTSVTGGGSTGGASSNSSINNDINRSYTFINSVPVI